MNSTCWAETVSSLLFREQSICCVLIFNSNRWSSKQNAVVESSVHYSPTILFLATKGNAEPAGVHVQIGKQDGDLVW